jgi:ABC-type nitrate/sulfonate/bicarbonate transport system permease component
MSEKELPDGATVASSPIPDAAPISAPAAAELPAKSAPMAGWQQWLARVRTIRDLPSQLESRLFGAASIALGFLAWHWLTMPWGDGNRILSATLLPSLPDTLASFRSLWFDRALTLSVLASLGRVLGGFLLTASIGIPLGLIAGSYLRVNAFLKPLSIFGRNVPLAALIPLTLIWFGLGELQKVMFIFLATVGFVLFDTTNAVQAVPDRFLDTAYTLGAHRTPGKGIRRAALFGLVYALIFSFGLFLLQNHNEDSASLIQEMTQSPFWWHAAIGFLLGSALWFPIQSHQLLRKVLLPLALPDIINNLRLIFGVAFGYIMLAEVIDGKRGLGFIITQSQRVGPREHIYLCLIIISLLAYGIDQSIRSLQRKFFPYLKNAES